MLEVSESRLKVGLMVTKPSRIFKAFRLESEAQHHTFLCLVTLVASGLESDFDFQLHFLPFFCEKYE